MRFYKAIIAVILSSSLFSTTTLADYTLGIGLASQTLTIDSDINLPSLDLVSGENELDSTALNLFVDVYRGSFRFNGNLSVSVYDDFALAMLTGSADYLIPMGESFSVFAGATFGSAAQAYASDAANPDTDNNVATSPVLGYQLGGIINLSDSLTLELGYNVRHMSLKTEFIGFFTNNTVEVTEASHAYINLGILFD